MNILNILSFTILVSIPALFPSASAAPQADWGMPTTDKATIRARDNQRVFPKLYGGIASVEALRDAFISALRKGDVPALEYLLKLGLDRNLAFDLSAPLDADGNSALHLAATGDKGAVVRLLLKRGANPNARNGRKDTPLLVAVKLRHSEIARVLLADKQTDAKLTNSLGESALSAAILADNEKMASEIVRALSPEAVQKTQISGLPLQSAAMSLDLPVAYRVSNLGRASQSYRDLVVRAVTGGAPKVLKSILADPNFKLTEPDQRNVFDEMMVLGTFAAFLEVAKKYPKMLSWNTATGDRPAHLAARQASVPALKDLFAVGADFGERNAEGMTVLEVARAMKRSWALLPAGRVAKPFDDSTAYIEKATMGGKPDLIATLDPPESNRSQWLYGLIKQGKGPELVKAYGIDWLSRVLVQPDRIGLFHFAVINSDSDGLKALLALGLDPEAVKDEEQMSAGRFARKIGSPLANSFPSSGATDTPARESLLSLGARRNSVLLIEAAYARGDSPIVESPEETVLGCGPTQLDAIDAYVKHPVFQSSLKVRVSKYAVHRCAGLIRYLNPECSFCPKSSLLLEKLLKSGVRPADSEQRENLAILAVNANDFKLVRALIEAGINPPNPFEMVFSDQSSSSPKTSPDGPDERKFIDFLTQRGIHLESRQFDSIANTYRAITDWNDGKLAGFDAMSRLDSAQVNPSLEIDQLWYGVIQSNEKFLARYGKVHRKVRLERDCGEARAKASLEFLLVRKNAERLFEVLWQDLLTSWKHIESKESQGYRALLTILDPRNLDSKYFSAAKYDSRIPGINTRFPKRDRAPLKYEESGGTAGFDSPLCGDDLWSRDPAKEGSSKQLAIRWACVRALEEASENGPFDIHTTFGAFKKGAILPLAGKEVSQLLRQDPKQLDIGLQVAISDSEGHFLARVKLDLLPPDPRQQKDQRRLEFFRELGVDRAESYLIRQHPQCAKPASSNGVSDRAIKPVVGEGPTVSDPRAPQADSAK